MLGASLKLPPKLKRAPRTPTRLETIKLGVAHAVVDDGDAAIFSFRRGLEHVVQQAVIGAIDGRLHEHRAVDPHRVVQHLHRLEGAVLRRLIKRVRIADRISLGVAEDMQVRVAGILRQTLVHGRCLSLAWGG